MRIFFVLLMASLLLGTFATRTEARVWSAFGISAPANAVTEVGCRSSGRKCPVGRQMECKDGRCSCKPCAY